MRFLHNVVPFAHAAAATSALAVAILGIGAAQPALADDAAVSDRDAAMQGQDASSQAASPDIRVTTFCQTWANEDSNLAGLAPLPSTSIGITVENDAQGAEGLYDAIDELRAANGLDPAVRDPSLEQCAYQRAAESTVVHSCARPDGSLFLTASDRTAAEILAYSPDKDCDARSVPGRLTGDDTYSASCEWLLTATNIGCALVRDAQGGAYWAVELSFDGQPAQGERAKSGQATYWSGAATANLTDYTLPEKIELKSGEEYVVTVLATASGTATYGLGLYPLEFSGAQVQVNPSCFVWNTANTGIVSTTAQGALTAHAPGTVTVSETDPDGSNPRFTVAIVDGGAKPTTYDLADCTFVGITGEDGLGNFYLDEQGAVAQPAFSLVTPDNTVIDPVNYRVTLEVSPDKTHATLTVKAQANSVVCKGSVSKELPVSQRPGNAGDSPQGAETDGAQDGGAGVLADPQEALGEDGADMPAAPSDDTLEQPQVLDGASPSPDQGGTTGTEGQDAAAGDLGRAEATLTFSSTIYTGSPVVPSSVVVRLDGKVLEEGRDYTLTYQNNVNAGTGRAVIEGAGSYTGFTEALFTIVPASIAGADVTMPNLAYTGEELAPRPVSVTLASGTGALLALAEGVDYVMEGYAGNVEVGEARATLHGTGNFTGTVEAAWKVVPQGTSDPGVTRTIPHTADPTDLAGLSTLAGAGLALAGAGAAMAARSQRAGAGRRTGTKQG